MATHKAEAFAGEAFLDRLSEHHRRSAKARIKRELADLIPDDGAAGIESELRQIERRMEALVAMQLESPGTGFDDVFRRQASELEARREELEAQAATRAVADADVQRKEGQRAKLLTLVPDLPALWEKASIEERQRMLELAIGEIRVLRGDRNVKSLEVDWLPWLS